MNNFHTSFNARNLEPKQVAEKFIFSPSFDKLKNDCNTVILGARGCGKTTLMKMLTLPALYNWSSIQSVSYRKEISFYAVYIPTDISWTLKDDGFRFNTVDNYFIEKISRFAVNTNVFESLCETIEGILKYEIIDFTEEKEIELCINLINRWKLEESTAPKLKYIKEALKIRRDDVSQLIPKWILNNDTTKADNDFFNLDYNSSILVVIDIFERIFKPSKNKWALCFDELEFAPAWLKKDLYRSLRSRDQKLLYKLSSSPTLPREVEEILHSEHGASVGNDFEAIKMWELQSDGDFQKKIIESILKSTKGDDIDILSYFGSNKRYLKGVEEFDDDSEYLMEIRNLIEKDDSFKEFLINNKINIDNPKPDKKTTQENALFRKIKPIVYFRNYFFKKNKAYLAKPILKQRKKFLELYSGYEILAIITDGNPRWLIGLINSILSKSDKLKAKPNIQYDEIIRVSDKFINFIINTPISSNKNDYSMERFIDKIGEYFQNELLGKEFKPEPISTFIFDLKTSRNFENIIEKGLLQGAFILTDDKETYDFEIENKRFKISYLFHPRYKLPLRKNKKINLSTIFKDVLQKKKNKRSKSKIENSKKVIVNQTSLF